MTTMRLIRKWMMAVIFLAASSYEAMPGVMITSILDGTLTGGCPKAIEIYVSGTENLNYYELWRSLNGAPFGEGSGAISSLFGTYTNTFVYLVKTDHVNAFHDVFGNEGIFANVYPMGIISGNGNDGFQLRQKVGSVVIDQVWLEDETDSYRDSYWYRKHGTGPDGGWNPSAWETPGNDALDGLDEAGLRVAVPFGTYAITWQGLTTDWNDNANWSNGMLPAAGTNVWIPSSAGNFPVITNVPSSPAVCRNLSVLDSATLTIPAGKALTVYGNLALDTLPVTEPESGVFLLSGPDPAPAGSLLIRGVVSGNATIRRFIEKDNRWHFISSPVENQPFQPGFVPDPLDASFDLYYWEESAPDTMGWINVRGPSGTWNPEFEDSFISGKGYLVAYSPSNEGETIRTFNGSIISGNSSLLLDHNGNHWNLLGNPYTCAIDWSSGGIDKSAVAGSAMYIWDQTLNENLGGYRTHNGSAGVPAGTSSVIPGQQGFFVKSLLQDTLKINIGNDDPLVHGDQAFYKRSDSLTADRVRIKINKDLYGDETLIYFDPAATNGFDPSLDVEKLYSHIEGVPEISSLAGTEHDCCINILSSRPCSIPLNITFDGNDSLLFTAIDFGDFDPETGIFLEDVQARQWVNLRETPGYKYQHNPLQVQPRFVLHFMTVATSENTAKEEKPVISSRGNTIFVSNESATASNVCIYSLDGKRIISVEIPGGSANFPVGLPGGLYVVVMTNGNTVYKEKVVIF